MPAKRKKPAGPPALAVNRKARRDYQILDNFEAGIELRGTEVKSIREGKISLNESYASIDADQVYIHQCRIEPYSHGNQFNHDPMRPKRLLLHRTEIHRLQAQVREKGLTLVPLKFYLKRGRVKVDLGLARGKDVQDKRETIKRRTADREAQRAIAEHRRR